jgi:integrase
MIANRPFVTQSPFYYAIALKVRLTKKRDKTDHVVTSPEGSVLPYNRYLAALKRYCKEAKVPTISTHGIRHSTAELYLAHGATHDDMRRLFAHSEPKLTDRYVRNWGSNVDSVAKRLRLFVNNEPTTKTDHATEPKDQDVKVSS